MLTVATISAQALARVLDQSVDCVKLIGLEGDVLWMNSNGLCAMEIDDFQDICGRQWDSLWPEESRHLIRNAIAEATTGPTVRFQAACPTARGALRFWHVTVSKVTGTAGEDIGFLAISRDISEAERQRHALAIAAEEMRHRLRNTYAMIGSLLNGFARGDPGNEAFARQMQARLSALSAAQLLFTDANVPCDLAGLIPALVEPFDSPLCKVVMAKVASVVVDRGQADAIALAIGELAVNSAKHGAMAHGGTVDVSAASNGAQVEIVWTEVAQDAITRTARKGGQGLRLIERIVQARDGQIDTRWDSHGPVVTLRFSLPAA